MTENMQARRIQRRQPRVARCCLNDHIPTASQNKLIFIEGTGHTYQRKEQETADELLKLMKNWGY